MAWGTAVDTGIDDVVERVRRNDATLTSLYLMRTRRFDDGGARALGEALVGNTTLAELHLSSHPVSTDQARSLASGLAKNRHVRHVSIGNSTLGDEALVALCDGFRTSSSLETLDLEKKGLTGASCGPLGEAVLQSRAIRRVMLSDNDLGDRGVADFLRCASKLDTLELCSCLKEAGQWMLVAQAMAETFPEARSLRRLELDRNALDEQGATALASSLSRLQALESLSLNGNSGLGARGVHALAFPPSLRRLDIGSTSAGDDGLRSLARLIASGKLPKLEYVNVCGCGATSVGVAALLDSLEVAGKEDEMDEMDEMDEVSDASKRELIEVDAGGNILSDGAESAVASMVRCRRLQSLRLHGCNLTAAGSEALVRVFDHHGRRNADTRSVKDENAGEPRRTPAHALRDLDLSGNGIPEAHMLAVLDALPRAVAPNGPFPSLKTLIIAANPDVEGPKIAERIESLTELGVVIMRAANDGDRK